MKAGLLRAKIDTLDFPVPPAAGTAIKYGHINWALRHDDEIPDSIKTILKTALQEQEGLGR
jgi:hypothetical protein